MNNTRNFDNNPSDLKEPILTIPLLFTKTSLDKKANIDIFNKAFEYVLST